MKVLLIGGGGREHSLAWKLAQSPKLSVLYAAPGNPGIARHAKCLPINADAIDELAAFAEGDRIDLTVVGPEAPLVAGIVGRVGSKWLCIVRPVQAGARVVVEEFVQGEEASFFALSNGRDVLPFGVAQDHKRVFDGDQGPNTGGMGAYSPAPIVDERVTARVMERIVRPTIRALAAE